MDREYYESFEWFWDKQTDKKENTMHLDDIQEKINKIEDVRDLRVIQQFLKDRRNYLGSRIKHKLSVGDEVYVTGSNGIESGTIVKINRTRAVVDIENQRWTVPFSMITLATYKVSCLKEEEK